MKKQLTVLLLVFALLLTTAGCASVGYALDAAEDKIEYKMDAAEDAVENAIRKAAAPAPAQPAPTQPAATEPAPTTSAPAAILTKEDAEKIALEYLGFTADQVQRLRTEYEIDDGIPQYDVEFHQGDWEYEFEIHAETGKILSYDKDHIYD